MDNKLNFSLKIFFISVLSLSSNLVFSMCMAYRHPYRLYTFKIDSKHDLKERLFKNVIYKNHSMVNGLLGDNTTKSFSYFNHEGVTIDLYDIARYNKDERMIRILKKYGCKEEISDRKASPLVIAAFCDYSDDVKNHLVETIKINANTAFIDNLHASCVEKEPVNLLSKNKEILALENIEKQILESLNIREALAVSVDKDNIASLSVLLNNSVIQKFLGKDDYQRKCFNVELLDSASSHNDTATFVLLLKSPCVNNINHVQVINRRPYTILNTILRNNDTQKIMLIKQYGGLKGKECLKRREVAKQEITRILFGAVKNKRTHAVEIILKADNNRNIFYEFPRFAIKIDLYDIARYNKDERMIRILKKYGCKEEISDRKVSPLVIAAFCDYRNDLENILANTTKEDIEPAIDVATERNCSKSLEILQKKYSHDKMLL